MRNGTITVAEFAQRVRPLKGLALRLAVYWHDNRWTVGLLDAHYGPSHALPKWRKYTYRGFAFVASRVPGASLADWVTAGHGGLGGLEFSLPELSTIVNWQQSTSQPGWAIVPIRRPSTTYMLYGAGHLGNLVSLEVVGGKAPYFRDWRLACLALLYDRWDSSQTFGLPSEVVALRIEPPGPWLENVHVGAATLRVTVGGAVGRAARLQVVSPAGELGNFAVTKRTRTFDVPATLPPGLTHVVLIRDDEVLDARTISMTPLGPHRVQVDDVTFDPPSRTESLEGQIAGGEGPTTEFKEDVPKHLDKIPVAVSAFANTAGGAIFVGVDDHGTIKGIAPDRVARLADSIINRLRQRVQPFPPVRPETAVIDGLTVLVLWVDAGPEAPFGVGDKPAAYYVRRGGNNFHATPDEIRALVRARSTVTNPFLDSRLQ